jgi:hypothetical protein
MSQYHNLMQLMGTIAARQISDRIESIKNLQDAEFRAFSQFGDDGIIQYLIEKCKIDENERSFVEFGVENYLESNTRFLLVKDNWSGLVMDSSPQNIGFVKSDEVSWRYDLESICCFVTPDNINFLLESRGFSENVGIFSVDIDGMDYWVWKSLEVARPVIVMGEYNSVFGQKAKVTVPYQENFDRRAAHHSTLYAGASLGALVHLGIEKGYSFVGSNSAGNTAYFLRNDRVSDVPVLTVEQGYVESKFRESRDQAGQLTHARAENRLRIIEHMPVYDIDTGSIKTLHEILNQLSPSR